jgi:hypothetical protein
VAVAKKQTAAKPRTRTAKKTAATSDAAVNETAAVTETAAVDETAAVNETAAANETAKTPDTPKPEARKPAPPTPNATEPGNRVSVTIPLDSAVVGVALKAATLPVTAAKKVAQNKNGIPAYVAVGGLAVIGAVEWPIAAVGGLSLAALRRWGPLKPEQQEPKKGA